MQNSRKLNDNAVKQIAFLLYLLYSFIVSLAQILYISSSDIVHNFEIDSSRDRDLILTYNNELTL